ncbi:MAG: hypothetical protein PHT77_11705 [Bacteroidales bacterium]|nr:hypothetical protein [Bacteroidales bacterium]MDD3962512.1 hypothetical protein [Bacteroidales bacterium]
MRLGLRDTQVQAPTKTSIGLWGIEDQHLSSTIQKQQLFWIGNHFEADIRQNFADTLSKAIEQGYTKEMLADALKDQFNDIANRSSHYWQGLAEPNTTSLWSSWMTALVTSAGLWLPKTRSIL